MLIYILLTIIIVHRYNMYVYGENIKEHAPLRLSNTLFMTVTTLNFFLLINYNKMPQGKLKVKAKLPANVKNKKAQKKGPSVTKRRSE